MLKEHTIDNYTYFISDDGLHIYNSKMKERPIQYNKKRQNRGYIKLNGKGYYLAELVARAYPEICGEWFKGCEVHHKDGNTLNNNINNLVVLSKQEHLKLHRGIIKQYNMDGGLIGEYTSSLEAEAKTNISSAAIRMCICGKTQICGGYIWKREL